jgi:hypothetical protein
VADLAAQHDENRANCHSWIDVGTAGENIDVGELIFRPGRYGDVGFAEHEDACRSVGLEGLNQLGADSAAEQAGGLPHGGHNLFWRCCRVTALGDVEDSVDHRPTRFRQSTVARRQGSRRR